MFTRIFAALVAVVFATAALAQSTESKPKAAAEAKPKPKPKPKPKADSADAADKKTDSAEKPKAKPANSKPAEKKQAAKPKPKPEAKSGDDDDKDDAPAKKKTEKPSTTGSAGAASASAKSSLREAFATLPLAERIALQSDLIWTGDFNGLVDGQFSDRLADAVSNYQKRNKKPVTGVLNPQERAGLSAAVKPRQDEVGWQLAVDPVMGARVGLPGKLATKITQSPSGTRWSSEQGQLQIETFKVDTGATLEAIFEQQKKLPRQRITYNVIRPDFFVVSGMRGLKKMYIRAFARDGEVRGITILYDQAMEGTMDPIVVAMSSAFVPFAGNAGAGASDGLRRKVEYATGVVVSTTGHIVTARHAVDGCSVVSIPGVGQAERLAEDRDAGFALLRVYGAYGVSPVSVQGSAGDGDNVTLVGIADPQSQAGGNAITTASVRRSANALDSAAAPGFSGAPATDREGRFVGVAIQRSQAVAGSASSPPAMLVPVERLRAFLDANFVPPGAGRSGLDGVKDATVRVICVRQ